MKAKLGGLTEIILKWNVSYMNRYLPCKEQAWLLSQAVFRLSHPPELFYAVMND